MLVTRDIIYILPRYYRDFPPFYRDNTAIFVISTVILPRFYRDFRQYTLSRCRDFRRFLPRQILASGCSAVKLKLILNINQPKYRPTYLIGINHAKMHAESYYPSSIPTPAKMMTISLKDFGKNGDFQPLLSSLQVKFKILTTLHVLGKNTLDSSEH